MSPIRTLIVDDEPLARKRMRGMLENDERVQVVAECCDGNEALAAIRNFNPELIFLDIQMPELDGFEVVKAIDFDEQPVIVFVTAFNEHAVRAFEINALDYLLKPYDVQRLTKTINRAEDLLASRRSEKADSQSSDFEKRLIDVLDRFQSKNYVNRLAVKSDDRLCLVVVEEIKWIESAGNYVRLHVGSHQHLLRESMKGIENRLDPLKFARVHRSTIVNLEFIDSLEPTFHGDYQIRLTDGTSLPLSRNYRSALRERFGDQI